MYYQNCVHSTGGVCGVFTHLGWRGHLERHPRSEKGGVTIHKLLSERRRSLGVPPGHGLEKDTFLAGHGTALHRDPLCLPELRQVSTLLHRGLFCQGQLKSRVIGDVGIHTAVSSWHDGRNAAKVGCDDVTRSRATGHLGGTSACHPHELPVAVSLEELVVVGARLRTTYHTDVAPAVELASKGRILGLLVKVLRQDFGFKGLLAEDHKTATMGKPGNDIGIIFIVENLHELQVGKQDFCEFKE